MGSPNGVLEALPGSFGGCRHYHGISGVRNTVNGL